MVTSLHGKVWIKNYKKNGYIIFMTVMYKGTQEVSKSWNQVVVLVSSYSIISKSWILGSETYIILD